MAEIDYTGKQLAGYRVLRKLGQGGMATVYKAHEDSLNRVVALKVIGFHLSENAQFIERFKREAQAAAQLSHPNIVQVYAIGEENGVHFFAMEYVKGLSLREIIESEGFLTAGRAVPILEQVCEALAVAHDAGIVHRDIKPANIMIDEAGRARVADFGIAQMVTEDRLTQTGMMIGTPEYISPEQCRGKKLDGRSDLYALGVTFFQMLSGRTPFQADTPAELVLQIIEGPSCTVGSFNPTVPAGVQAIVERMMCVDPQSRFQSAEDLLHALRGVDTEPTTTTVRMAGAAAAADPLPEPPGPTELVSATPTEATPAPTEAMPAATEAKSDPQPEPPGPTELVSAGPTEMIPAATEVRPPAPTEAMPSPVETAAQVPETAAAPAPTDVQPSAPVEAATKPKAAEAPASAAADDPSPATAAYATSGDKKRNPVVAIAAMVVVLLALALLAWQFWPQGGNDEEQATLAADTSGAVNTTNAPTEDATDDASSAVDDQVLGANEATAADSGDPTGAGPEGSPAQPAATGSTTPQQAEPASTGPSTEPSAAPAAEPEPPVEAEVEFIPPPINSIVAETSGEYEYVNLVSTWIEGVLAGQNFEIVDYPSSPYASIREAARFHMVSTATLVSVRQLEYFGRVQPQYTVALTMRITDLADGVTVAGPANTTIQYTDVNFTENLERGTTDLARRLARQLRQRIQTPF